jgi:hypothetical protein
LVSTSTPSMSKITAAGSNEFIPVEKKSEVRNQKLEVACILSSTLKTPVIPSEARNLALACLGRPTRRRARFLSRDCGIGMTTSSHGFRAPVSRRA